MLEKVTAELLAEIFLSKGFLENLSKASKITQETYNETGFTNYFDVNSGKIINGDIKIGTYFGMENAGLRESQENSPLMGLLGIDIHFHPLTNGPVFPSDGDLTLASNMNEGMIYVSEDNSWYDVEIKPLCVIGKARAEGDIELLLYNAKGNLHEGNIERVDRTLIEYLDERGIEPYEEEISNSKIKTSEVRDLMENSGCYNAEVLNFSNEIHDIKNLAKVRNSMTEEVSEKMKKFEYVLNYQKSDTSFIDSLGFK